MSKIKYHFSKEFKKGLKRAKKKGKKLYKLWCITEQIITGTLEPKHKDHALKGDLSNYRECHIEPNWLLVYRFENKLELLCLYQTGTHQEIFKM